MKRRITVAMPPPAQQRSRDVVLYVEDEASNRQVIHLWLNAEFEVIFAQNDVEACDLLKAHHHRISCVLMDIQLQGSQLSGIQLTKLFRGKPLDRPLPEYAQNLPTLHAPIIFLTAYGESFSDGELETAGGNRIFSKPVNFGQLNLALAQAALTKTLGRFARS